MCGFFLSFSNRCYIYCSCFCFFWEEKGRVSFSFPVFFLTNLKSRRSKLRGADIDEDFKIMLFVSVIRLVEWSGIFVRLMSFWYCCFCCFVSCERVNEWRCWMECEVMKSGFLSSLFIHPSVREVSSLSVQDGVLSWAWLYGVGD